MNLITFSNPVWYGEWRIYHNNAAMGRSSTFAFCHDDYDGAEDANDNRCGYGASIEDCINEIEELEA